MKAIEILKNINVWGDVTEVQEQIDKAIAELEALENRSCYGCKYLEKKEKNLQFECLIEICRTCSRNNNDNFEGKVVE